MSNKYKVKCLVSLVETIEIDTQGSLKPWVELIIGLDNESAQHSIWGF